MLTTVELVIQTILGLVVDLLPDIKTSSTAAAKIIVMLEKILPDIIAIFPNLITSVKGIINAMQSSGNLTADEMTTLETQAATLDAALIQAGKDEGLIDPLAPPAST